MHLVIDLGVVRAEPEAHAGEPGVPLERGLPRHADPVVPSEDQVTAPVRWVECVQAMATMAPGARFVEVGPGSVLSGLIRRIVPGAETLTLGTADELERFLA